MVADNYLQRPADGWAGNVEGTWREQLGYVIWPALKGTFANRRTVPERIARNRHLRVHRLRSDRDVRQFLERVSP